MRMWVRVCVCVQARRPQKFVGFSITLFLIPLIKSHSLTLDLVGPLVWLPARALTLFYLP